MLKTKVDNCIFKTLGFYYHKKDTIKKLLENDFVYKEFSENTNIFLENNYHSEFVNLMFSKEGENGVDRYIKNINHKINIGEINKDILINNIETFLFNDQYQKNQTAIFSIDYSLDNLTLDEISYINYSLRQHDFIINYNNKNISVKDYIAENLMKGISFFDNNNSIEQFAGSKFKNYIVLDFKPQNQRDDLLFEFGTFSKVESSKGDTLESPSEIYKTKVLSNKISCFKNYECLALLNSFTVIGSDNYDRGHLHTHSSWNDIYFSIYVYNLYLKCTLQILSNDFSKDSMAKRYEFQNFYSKYYRQKISYNFLPNEIFIGIVKSMQIDEDLDYVQDKLETLAVQVNEKQQRQQELLLLIISVLAVLELPLYIEGIRKIIGIENLVVYNSATYIGLIIVVLIFIISKIRKKY